MSIAFLCVFVVFLFLRLVVFLSLRAFKVGLSIVAIIIVIPTSFVIAILVEIEAFNIEEAYEYSLRSGDTSVRLVVKAVCIQLSVRVKLRALLYGIHVLLRLSILCHF